MSIDTRSVQLSVDYTAWKPVHVMSITEKFQISTLPLRAAEVQAHNIYSRVLTKGVGTAGATGGERLYPFAAPVTIRQVYQLVTHSFAQQDCRRAHLKNPKCIKTLRPGLTGGDHRRRPPSWWVGVYHNTAPSPRTPSLAQPFGFRARLVPTIGGGLA